MNTRLPHLRTDRPQIRHEVPMAISSVSNNWYCSGLALYRCDIVTPQDPPNAPALCAGCVPLGLRGVYHGDGNLDPSRQIVRTSDRVRPAFDGRASLVLPGIRLCMG